MPKKFDALSTLLAVIVYLVSTPAVTGNQEALYDESVNHVLHDQIYQYDPKLKALFGDKGVNNICWPSSLAHRMSYFQRSQNPKFSNLLLKDDDSLNVQKFVRLCHTSLNGGTSQKRKLPCIREFFRSSGYPGDAYEIGKAASDPRSRRAVTVQDLLEPLRKGYDVILHVGWMKFDPQRHAWIEKGSHSVNAYGFSYNRSWGDNRIILQIANPGTDYSPRPADHWYDSIELNKLSREDGASSSLRNHLLLSGPGFSKDGRLAVLEDVFIFFPEKMSP